jgi:drug/metabolite transporter (DMT)-like permease
MFKNDVLKGYMLVMVTVLAMANVYIFSKAALNLVSLAQFGLYWFSMAFIFNFILNRKKLSAAKITHISRKGLKRLTLFSLLELCGTAAFFLAIKTMSNPALVSFLANLTPVFVTLLGILLLKERFTGIEIFGIFLAVSGSFVIAYNPGTEIPSDFLKAIGLMLITSICYSITTIISKKNIKEISPAVFTMSRVVILLIASIIFIIISQDSLVISGRAFLNISVGAFLGPFLATFTSYSSLKYIEASRSSVLSSSKSVFVVITSYLYFNLLPGNFQVIGGILTITGVLLISLGNLLRSKKETLTEIIY